MEGAEEEGVEEIEVEEEEDKEENKRKAQRKAQMWKLSEREMPNHRAETKLRNGNRRRRVEGQTDRESDKQIDR